MYNKTVTIFNYYESASAAVWYPHVLSGVDLITDKGAILKKYGPDSTDNAELHIPYTADKEKKIIIDNSGKNLFWIPPKEWQRQVNDDLPLSITFCSDDFFIEGIWSKGMVNEDDYLRQNGFYNYINNQFDFVFKISSVGGPYTIIPHFEILGK